MKWPSSVENIKKSLETQNGHFSGVYRASPWFYAERNQFMLSNVEEEHCQKYKLHCSSTYAGS